MIRAAVVGISSYYSVNFARALREIGPPRVDLVGAAALGFDDETIVSNTRMSRAAFGERFGTKIYERAEDLLDDAKPDLVCVASANTERASHAVLALNAGADVYVAKPMTSSLAGARTILDTARKHPNRLVGALNPGRFPTAIREAHRRVREGEIGEVLTVRAWIQHGAADPHRSRKGNPEMDDGQGGIEYSLGVYAADLLNWFVDAAGTPAIRTFAEYDTLNTDGYPYMDSGKAVVRYGQGKMGSMDIYYSVPCPAPLWEIEASGRDGIIRTNGGNYEGAIWRRGGLDRPRIEPFSPTRDDTILAAIQHVVSSCEQRRPFEMDAEDGFRAIELCAAWKQSADSHQPVALPLK